MKRTSSISIFTMLVVSTLISVRSYAQLDSTKTLAEPSHNIFHKEDRLRRLGQEMTAYNESLAKKTRMVKGYRLMLLNTNDRTYAFKVRNTLMQQMPEHKLYLTFIAPNIKLKMGNFTDKATAEKVKKQLQDMKLLKDDIYLINEAVEFKPVEKTEENEEP